MKFLSSKNATKKLMIIIVIIMLFNFITPNYSQAGTFGGELFKPIGQLLCGIGDSVIKILQQYFMGDDDIKSTAIGEIEQSAFHIKYSPEIIFSNKVPGLDVNFFNPQPDYQSTKENYEWKIKGDYALNDSTLINTYGFDQTTAGFHATLTDNELWNGWQVGKRSFIFSWENKGKMYMLINTMADPTSKPWWAQIFGTTIIGSIDGLIQSIVDFSQGTDFVEDPAWTLYEESFTQTNGKVIKSSASILQNTIATWYKVLRAIALVGLLSVLVYIGIRILLSSLAQDKAKYQKMIVDWVAAICILFILQYIMTFTLIITQKLTDVFTNSYKEATETTVVYNGTVKKVAEDSLMSSLRTSIGEDPEDFENIFGLTVIYLVLVIYTVVFTWHYLKRLIYMAFFTMIAPLIALTYPIDKVKDGQAQAFNMWTKEYIFNALIQPVHLLLYYIFVKSAVDLSKVNLLYALAAIAFLIPAEKFFKKMFGFEKASTMGSLGAAAGGAMVMNAINKMGQKSSGGQQGQKNANKSVRTAGGSGPVQNSPVGQPLDSGNAGGPQPPPQPVNQPQQQPLNPGSPQPVNQPQQQPLNPGSSQPVNQPQQQPLNPGSSQPVNQPQQQPLNPGSSQPVNQPQQQPLNPGSSQPVNQPQQQPLNPGSSQPVNSQTPPTARTGGSIINGFKAVGGQYVNRKLPGKILKGAGRLGRKAVIGGLGAATLGTVGLAAGLATGDPSNVFKYAGAGALAGGIGANKIGNKATEIEKKNREAFKKGYDPDAYKKKLAMKEAWENPEVYKQYKADSLGKKAGFMPEQFKKDANQFIDGGIDSSEEIAAALKLKDKNKWQDNNNALHIAQLNREISDAAYGDDTKRQAFHDKIKESLSRNGMQPDQAEQEATRQIKFIGDYKKLLS